MGMRETREIRDVERRKRGTNIWREVRGARKGWGIRGRGRPERGTKNSKEKITMNRER